MVAFTGVTFVSESKLNLSDVRFTKYRCMSSIICYENLGNFAFRLYQMSPVNLRRHYTKAILRDCAMNNK